MSRPKTDRKTHQEHQPLINTAKRDKLLKWARCLSMCPRFDACMKAGECLDDKERDAGLDT